MNQTMIFFAGLAIFSLFNQSAHAEDEKHGARASTGGKHYAEERISLGYCYKENEFDPNGVNFFEAGTLDSTPNGSSGAVWVSTIYKGKYTNTYVVTHKYKLVLKDRSGNVIEESIKTDDSEISDDYISETTARLGSAFPDKNMARLERSRNEKDPIAGPIMKELKRRVMVDVKQRALKKCPD